MLSNVLLFIYIIPVKNDNNQCDLDLCINPLINKPGTAPFLSEEHSQDILQKKA